MMNSVQATIITLLIVYLLIGNVLWAIGVKSFGGIETYREYLRDHNDNVPIWFIFTVFIIFWPVFLRRNN